MPIKTIASAPRGTRSISDRIRDSEKWAHLRRLTMIRLWSWSREKLLVCKTAVIKPTLVCKSSEAARSLIAIKKERSRVQDKESALRIQSWGKARCWWAQKMSRDQSISSLRARILLLRSKLSKKKRRPKREMRYPRNQAKSRGSLSMSMRARNKVRKRSRSRKCLLLRSYLKLMNERVQLVQSLRLLAKEILKRAILRSLEEQTTMKG